MCGFIGGISPSIQELDEKKFGILDRRGPDHRGLIRLPNGLVLAATRLAMTDPHPRSNQPMKDVESENILVFNGEIYNYLLLKDKLKNLGVVFNTESDTEVLLKLLTKFGEGVLNKLEGMFAFAFYNRKENSIMLSRDVLGKKPLYFSLQPKSFIFSSSLSSVKNLINTSAISPNSLYTYLKLGYLIDPNTIYSDIYSIGPGESLLIDLNNLRIKKSSNFFPKTFSNNDSLDLQSSLDIEILNRVDGHSNFAISLSGGTDSSIIALRSARLGFRPVTYSLGFTNSDKERYSEDSIAAKNIAKKLALSFQLVEMPLPNLIPEILTQYVAAMEEPNSNPTGLSMMVLYSAMSKNGEKVVLTGDGADEIFCGYERYKKASQISLLPQFGISIIAKTNKWKHFIPKTIQNLMIAIEPANSDEFWLFWHSITAGQNLNKLYPYEAKIEMESIGGKTLNTLYGNGSRTSELMVKDLFIWLSMESNRKLDRISMWNSIEARSPFQSERMIAKAFIKMKQTNFKVADKYFLKQSINEYATLPILKNKKGFISPLGHWIRSNPDMVLDSLEHLKHLPFFDKKSLDELKKSVYKSDYRDFKLVWSLVVFSYWLKYAGNKI